jgi:hypothetical protein
VNATEIISILDELQDRLNGPAKYIFELTVRQVYISSFVELTASIVAILVSLFIINRVYNWYNQPRKNAYDDDRIVGFVAVVIPASIVCVGGFLLIAVSLVSLLNPEHPALMNILEAINPL